MHSRVVDVTKRLAARSAASRAACLEHIDNTTRRGPAPRWRELLTGFRRSVSAADQGAAVFTFLPTASISGDCPCPRDKLGSTSC